MLAVAVLVRGVIFDTMLWALTVSFPANAESNSCVSLSQKCGPRIIYGHTMCFSGMQAVPLCYRKVSLWSQGAAGCPQPLQSTLSAASLGAWDGRKT